MRNWLGRTAPGAAMLALSGLGCGSHTTASTTPVQTAAPQFSIAAGTYTTAQQVLLTDATPSAAIYYTTDGSVPTSASPSYTAALNVASSETIQAVAIASGDSMSGVSSAAYTITPATSAPAMSVAAGTYTSAQTVMLSSATSGAKIYFTLDGSAPTTASTLYSGALTVSSSETVKAIAVAAGFSASPVTSATYLIITAGAVTGVVKGAKPISGAKVYLFTPGTSGYGGASVSLLNASVTGRSDSAGAYVTTASDGSFNLTGQFACSANQPLYACVTGGDAGNGTNPGIGLLAILGACPAIGRSITGTVNELTTIAAAYSFAGFATDATHVSSSGTALARVGVTNAFATASNLVNLPTGTALSTTPGGNGTVPQATLNTLANLLAGCVDTASGCATLLSTATADGTGAGAVPTETATAAINIAHHPGSNVAALYPAASSMLYSPALTSEPPDFTLLLSFTGGGLATTQGVAIDANGNVWTQDYGVRISELSPLGVPVFATGVDVQQASSWSYSTVGKPVAIDLQGNAWMVAGQGVFEVSNTGTLLSPAGGYPGGGSTTGGSVLDNDEVEVAIDAGDNVWVSHSLQNIVVKLSDAGSVLSPAGGYSIGSGVGPYGLAATNSGNVVVAGTTQLVTLSSSGAIVSSNSGCCAAAALAMDSQGNMWTTYQGDGVDKTNANGSTQAFPFSTPGAISDLAIDGAGNVWLPKVASFNYPTLLKSSVIELSNAGATLSPTFPVVLGGSPMTDSGFAYGEMLPPAGGIAVDGSGNVWIASYASTSTSETAAMEELVGIATPVVTPIVAGVKNSTVGMRP